MPRMQAPEKDRKRFLELIEKHQGILHRVCLAFGFDSEDRQDLFQEITLQLWRSFNSFKGKSSFSTWMYQVALNTAMLQRRKAARRPDLRHGGETEINRMSVDATAPQDEVELLRMCICELPPLDRAIALLHLEEKSYDDIAEITGLRRSNVSVRLVRLKERLRRALEAKGLGKEAFL